MKGKSLIVLSAAALSLAVGYPALAGDPEKEATEAKAAMEEAVPAEYVEGKATEVSADAAEKPEMIEAKLEEEAAEAAEEATETPEE